MKKVLLIIGKIFLWLFAAIGFLVVCGIIILLIKNPFNIRGMIFSGGDTPATKIQQNVTPSTGGTATKSESIPMTGEQKKALEDAGINPDALPAITPEMEECFREKLGNDRVDEIIKGATPSPLDLVKAGSCL